VPPVGGPAIEEGSNMTEKSRKSYGGRRAGATDAIYGLGLIGALVYYIQHGHGFWGAVLGILKAIVWPALLVYDALKHLAS
jgi:hypothetical protein